LAIARDDQNRVFSAGATSGARNRQVRAFGLTATKGERVTLSPRNPGAGYGQADFPRRSSQGGIGDRPQVVFESVST
jgi:hypothetical protein